MQTDTSPQYLRETSIAADNAWLGKLLLIALLGGALRLFHLARQGIWYDEAAQIFTTRYAFDFQKLFDPEFCNDAPLFAFLTRFLYEAILAIPGVESGSTACDFLLRLFPAVIGATTVCLIFFTGRAVTGSARAALFAAFLCAISPFQIYYSQDLRAYALHSLLNIMAFQFLLNIEKENRLRDWLGLTLALTAGLYNHFFMVWNIVAFNLYFALALRPHWKLLGRWIICNLAVIALSLPVLRMMLYVSMVFDSASETWYPTPTLFTALITLKTFFTGYTPNATAYKLILVAAIVFITLGTIALRKRPLNLSFLIVMAAAPIAISVLYWRAKEFPYYTHRLLIFSALPCYILAGMGIAALRKPALIAGSAAAIGILTLPALADHYAQRLHPLQEHTIGILYKNDNRAAARFVESRWQPGDTIAHRVRYTSMPFEYYLGTRQSIVEFNMRGIRAATQGYPSIEIYRNHHNMPVLLSEALEGANRLWLVASWWNPYDSETLKAALPAYLDYHATRQIYQPFDGLTVYLYELAPPNSATGPMRLADYGTSTTLYYPKRPSVAAGGTLAPGFPSPWEMEASSLRLRFEVRRTGVDVVEIPGGALNDVEIAIATAAGGAPRLQIPHLGRTLSEGDQAVIEGAQYSLIELDTDKATLASFPLFAEEEFTFRFAVDNTAAAPLNATLQIIESVETIFAMEFSTTEPGVGVWRPEFQSTFSPGPPFHSALAIVATLSPQTPGGKAIYTGIDIAKGQYEMYVRCAVNGSPSSGEPAKALFQISPANHNGDSPPPALTVGEIALLDPRFTGPRWEWRKVGTFESTGRPSRLTIIAAKGNAQTGAAFHLDRVAILPASANAGGLRAVRHQIELAPGASQAFPQSSTLNGTERKRVDIELYDSQTRDTRRIHFYVRRRS